MIPLELPVENIFVISQFTVEQYLYDFLELPVKQILYDFLTMPLEQYFYDFPRITCGTILLWFP